MSEGTKEYVEVQHMVNDKVQHKGNRGMTYCK